MIATGSRALFSYKLSEIDFRDKLILARKFQVEAEMQYKWYRTVYGRPKTNSDSPTWFISGCSIDCLCMEQSQPFILLYSMYNSKFQIRRVLLRMLCCPALQGLKNQSSLTLFLIVPTQVSVMRAIRYCLTVPALASLTAHSPADTFFLSPRGPIHSVMAAGLPVDFKTSSTHSASSTCAKNWGKRKQLWPKKVMLIERKDKYSKV